MIKQDIPFSQACENNKEPILAILKQVFSDARHVLEIGSGTGQHAVFFARGLPHLIWQTADQEQYHAGIKYYLAHFPSPNLKPPISLRIPLDEIERGKFDAYFTANTAHIMQASEVKHMMQSINQLLPQQGVFCQYGPFTIDGEFSSQSNADFHQRLVSEGYGGYRDLAELKKWAKNLSLDEIVQMPANNLMLIWKKH